MVELIATRGIFISHQTVHNWVLTFGAECGKLLRTFRRNKNRSKKWHVDHCTLKIKGEYYYFYRCFDKNGDLIDVMLSDSKDQDVAEQFFDQWSWFPNSVSMLKIIYHRATCFHPRAKCPVGLFG